MLHDQHAACKLLGLWPGPLGPSDSGTMWSIVGLLGCGLSVSSLARLYASR